MTILWEAMLLGMGTLWEWWKAMLLGMRILTLLWIARSVYLNSDI